MFIYFIENSETHNIKIGFSKNPIARLKQLQTGSSALLALVHSFPCDLNPKHVENKLHHMLLFYRRRGEWFHLPQEAKNWLFGINSDKELYESPTNK